MTQQPAFLRSGLSCHLFIYVVEDHVVEGGVVQDLAQDRPAAPGRYCTVLAYGRTLEAAERIAINRVHQHGLHIVRADTATVAPWLDPARDGAYLAELAQYGSALSLSEMHHPREPATAA